MSLEIKTFPPARVASMRYTGPYGHPNIALRWKEFGEWCAAQGLMSPRRKMYGVSLDNPLVTPPHECRYDLCMEVDAAFTVTDAGSSGVFIQELTGGRYACLPFKGTAAHIGMAWMAMFSQALPMSGLQRDDQPSMEVYLEDFELDPKTLVFGCLLCVPLRV